MDVLGLLLLILVIAQALVHGRPLSTLLTAASWILWAVVAQEPAGRRR